MAEGANTRSGECHCGAVRFEVDLSDGFNTIRRCTCSFCRMRGAGSRFRLNWAASVSSAARTC